MDRTGETRHRPQGTRRLRARGYFTRGELKIPKTEASMRAVPAASPRVDALDLIESNGSPLLFPGERGGYLDIHHFRPFQCRPAQKTAGITPTGGQGMMTTSLGPKPGYPRPCGEGAAHDPSCRASPGRRDARGGRNVDGTSRRRAPTLVPKTHPQGQLRPRRQASLRGRMRRTPRPLTPTGRKAKYREDAS
jgi:hypothetical protein